MYQTRRFRLDINAQVAIRRGLVVLALVGGALFLPSHSVAKPQLFSVRPYVWQRGEELEILFRGERLADVHQLLDYQQGITVLEWLPSDDARFAKAKIKVADDCELGRHALRLCTAAGITKLQLIYVSQHERIDEQEPNNSADQAHPVPTHCTVLGRRDGNHNDWFSIEAKQNQRVSCELVAIRLGGALFDARLDVFSEQGELIAESDDTLLAKQDPFLSFVPGDDATYYVRVASSAGEGNNNYFYALHVGSFPRPNRVTPHGGKSGEPLEVTWHYPDGTTQQQQLQLPSREALPPHDPHLARVFPQQEDQRAPSSLPLLITDTDPVREQEPNNTYPQATRIELPAAVGAKMDKRRDRDCFVFAAQKGQKLVARIFGRGHLRTRLDSDLAVRHGDGKFITSNDDQPDGPDSVVQFDVPADGDYLLVVRDHLNRGGEDFDYWLEVATAQPEIVLNLPERDRNRSITLAVPRGARMALRVTATKKFVDGPLDLQLQNLPDGLTAEPAVLAPGRPAAALLVSADSEAALQGRLVPLTGTLTAGEQTYPAHLLQKQLLVAGRNNIYVYGYKDSRLAVAVVDAAPFDLELVQPNVPMVRNGAANLKIVATRSEGFTAPITVRMLDNPPGISTRGSVTIPEGKNEITLPATANGNAALGPSQIVAIGTATVDGTQHELATPLITLEVVEPMLAVTFPKSKVARGQSTEVVIGLECKQPFVGEARAELLGIPAGVTAPPISFEHGATELKFQVSANEKARIGRAGGLICRLTVTRENEPIVHMLGRGQLRVDPAPTPPPTAAAASNQP